MPNFRFAELGEIISHRKEFTIIDDDYRYKRCRVQAHARGIVLRDQVEGSQIKTKKQQICRSNELLVAEIDAKVGGYGIVPPELDGAIVSSHYFLYSIDKSKVDTRFLGCFVNTHRFHDQVKAKGTTNYAAIRANDVLAYKIPLPSLNEQRRIIAKVETLTSRISEAKQLRQAIHADMKSLLVAMAHRNDLSDDEKQAQGWQRVTLNEVLTQVSDPITVELGKEYPHFGIYSFAKGLFKKASLLGNEIKATKLYRVHKGQLIYGRLNAYEGAFAIIGKDYDNHHVSNEFPTFECSIERVLPDFLLTYFSSPVVWESLKRKVTGIGGGAGNRRIRMKEAVFLSDEIWLPPIEWQQKIKTIAAQMTATKRDCEATTLQLDAILPSIFDKAFKGEL